MSTTIKRVPKPDFEKHNAEVEAIKKTIDALIEKRNKISGKFNRDANEKQNAERNELRGQLDKIRVEQGKIKKGRQEAKNQIKELQALRRKKNDELRNAKQKLSVSNVKDIDAQIKKLEKEIEAGVTVNEEKQLLKEISKLNQAKNTIGKVEKSVAEFNVDDKIKSLDEKIKAYDEKRKPLEAQYTEIRGKLDVIEKKRKEQSEDYKSNKEERDKIQKEIEANIQKRRDIVAAFKTQREEYNAFVKADRERKEAERKKKIQEERDQRLYQRFQAELELAEIPAFTEEINSCNTLIGILNNQLENKSESNTEAQKTSANLEASVPEGAVLLNSKSEREEEVFFSGKKKNKKQHNKAKEAKNAPIKFDLGVMEAFWKLKVEVPSSNEEIKEAIKTLEAKRDEYQKNSAEQTRKNKEEAERKIAEQRKKLENGEDIEVEDDKDNDEE
ncbi:hypothetical protein LY90DRAFT_375009 [Neocallimastix californiae]|jgi:uncharacterized coiled-coil DUF342 family protein|uniref:Nuclear segregation protein Bfr1 n=1 Tax=Neocallimastix californiae TaxID=1754190 RepID=A0A1Y2FPY6_9FUNG|nr:hypothetical protein LY90DRAFT_375009 [Neocallimastix californiae]|eukprot:ORY85266.1 hypothetical protein LY90DRAFT_375009 [Neocallimastix californiae]